MRVKGILAEDFVNYRLPSMFIMSAVCDWKCCKEACVDISVCQNAPLADSPTLDISNADIYEIFAHNNISKAVVIGGLEPFLQFQEVFDLITCFRGHGEKCDFVIYTGYYPQEIKGELEALAYFGNIIVKFGRYIPHRASKFDDVLGVTLASDNQFAVRLPTI